MSKIETCTFFFVFSNGNRSKRVKSDGDLKIKGSKSSAINKKPNLISEDDIQDVEGKNISSINQYLD